MACVKTGAHVYLEEYGEFVYGDMHQFGQTYVMRVAGRERTPINDSNIINYQVMNVQEDWRDKPYGTIVCFGVMEHGYEGKLIKDVLPHVKVGAK